MEEDVDDVNEEKKLEAEVKEIIGNATISKEQLKNKDLRKKIIANYKNVEVSNEVKSRRKPKIKGTERKSIIAQYLDINEEDNKINEEQNRIKQRTLEKIYKQKQQQEQQ